MPTCVSSGCGIAWGNCEQFYSSESCKAGNSNQQLITSFQNCTVSKLTLCYARLEPSVCWRVVTPSQHHCTREWTARTEHGPLDLNVQWMNGAVKRGKGTRPGVFFCRGSGPSCWVQKYFALEDSHIVPLRIQNSLQHPPLCGYTHKQVHKGQTCSFHTNKTHIQSENVVEIKSLWKIRWPLHGALDSPI